MAQQRGSARFNKPSADNEAVVDASRLGPTELSLQTLVLLCVTDRYAWTGSRAQLLTHVHLVWPIGYFGLVYPRTGKAASNSVDEELCFAPSNREDSQSRSLSAPYRHVSTQLIETVRELGVPLVSPGSQILDFGCAGQPYRGLFGSTVQYVGADLQGNPDADVVINSDGTVPLPDNSLDFILSTQVLEHVQEPAVYLSECERMLKSGGSLLLTTHGLMSYHPDPNDYWRWTQPGLQKMVTNTGLEVREIRGLLGPASAALQLFQNATYWRLSPRLRKPYIAVMQQLVARSDKRYAPTSRLHDSLVIALTASRR